MRKSLLCLTQQCLTLLCLTLFSLISAGAVRAEEGAAGIFRDGIWNSASFGQDFWADMYSTSIRVDTAYATNSPDYDWGGFDAKYRPFIFTNLGADIPVWSGNFAGGKYGLSITLPFMIELWYDRFEFVTSPIINTSYRFGAFDTVFLYRLGSPLPLFSCFYIHNWAVKLSPLRHESTHLGDELAIYRMNKDFPITRTDVISNYVELVFSINDPDGQPRFNQSFNFGVLYNWKKGGWYNILVPEEVSPEGAAMVEPGKFPFEFFAQYQYQSPLFSQGFQFIASAEYRLRERHRYPFSYSGGAAHEEKEFVNCFNVLAGVRFDNQKRTYFSKTGIGARYYFGLNPYGQFRSMPYYQQWGLALIFE